MWQSPEVQSEGVRGVSSPQCDQEAERQPGTCREWGGGEAEPRGRLPRTCSSSRSAGSAWLGTSSVSISDITLTFPFTISSSLRSFPICNTQWALLGEAAAGAPAAQGTEPGSTACPAGTPSRLPGHSPAPRSPWWACSHPHSPLTEVLPTVTISALRRPLGRKTPRVDVALSAAGGLQPLPGAPA